MHCRAIFKPFLRQSTTLRITLIKKLAERCIFYLFSISCGFAFSSLACSRPKEMRYLKEKLIYFTKKDELCETCSTPGTDLISQTHITKGNIFCETWSTPRHWSGFLSSFAAARAHWERRGSWFSSEKQLICWKVPIIRLIAASCARLSEISSSYNEKACNIIIILWVMCE